jgi:hypothetical protein
MAWLSVAAGERQALDLFWNDARKAPINGLPDCRNGYVRAANLNLRLQGLCERMGTDYDKIADHARTMNAEWP